MKQGKYIPRGEGVPPACREGVLALASHGAWPKPATEHIGRGRGRPRDARARCLRHGNALALGFALCVLATGVMVGAWAEEQPPLAAKGPEKFDLRVNFDPGAYVVTESVTVRVVSAGERPSASEAYTLMVMDMTVGKPDAQGNRDLAVTYRQVAFHQKRDDQVVVAYDSSAGVPVERLPPAGRMFEGMIGRTLTITLDPHGKVSGMEGVDEMVTSMLRSAGMDEGAAGALRHLFGDRMVEETFGQILIMPGKPVARGETWDADKRLELPIIGPVQYKQVCTLTDVKRGVATVEVAGVLRGVTPEANPGPPLLAVNELTLEGTTLMDVATGMAKQSEVTQKGTLTLTVGEGESKKETTFTLNGAAKTTIVKK